MTLFACHVSKSDCWNCYLPTVLNNCHFSLNENHSNHIISGGFQGINNLIKVSIFVAYYKYVAFIYWKKL